MEGARVAGGLPWESCLEGGSPAAFLEEMCLWMQASHCQLSHGPPGLWWHPHHAGGGTEAVPSPRK